jgi:hypothetical protein
MQFISSPIAAAIERAQTRAGEQAMQDREYLVGIALARTMFAQQLIDEADYREAECLLFLRYGLLSAAKALAGRQSVR